MRTIALTKPHLSRSPAGYWVCNQAGRFVGAGWTPAKAYASWVARNGGAG